MYFSCLEALQNVAKYAEATIGRTSRLDQRSGELGFAVRTTAVGSIHAPTGYGTGLQGIADRLGALDGRLEVESAPGAGATLRGRVPVHAEERRDVVPEGADVHV